MIERARSFSRILVEGLKRFWGKEPVIEISPEAHSDIQDRIGQLRDRRLDGEVQRPVLKITDVGARVDRIVRNNFSIN